MKEIALVIMAAGIGSRYGAGIKQLQKVVPQGEIIIDYSIHDALEAGFNRVVFIIRKDIEAEFKEAIGSRIEKICPVTYVFQDKEDLPDGFTCPPERTKPWGTGQAVLACRDVLHGPFAVINADDYYGREAFQLIYDYLSAHEDDEKYRYTMVGYLLGNTVTDNGHVSRGICETNMHGELVSVEERTRIEKRDGGIAFTEDDGKTWTEVSGDAVVSMNMWGFTKSILHEIRDGFPAFLDKGLKSNPMKCEYYLPAVVSRLLEEGKATAAVLKSADKWYGITYKEDKPVVVAALQKMKDDGIYPMHLWEEE